MVNPVISSPGVSVVSTWGVSPGGRCRLSNAIVRRPFDPRISTLASSAASAWPKSPG
jgi:hypothetical protein